VCTSLLNESEAAKRLQVSVGLLRKWRSNSEGPVVTKMGRCIRYACEDLDHFVAQHRVSAQTESTT
jgi:Helix-turn-helix domain